LQAFLVYELLRSYVFFSQESAPDKQDCLIDCFNGVIGAVYRVALLFVMQVKLWPL